MDHVIVVPADQDCAVDIWNLYSPIQYQTKRQQREIKKLREFRAREVRESYASLFEAPRPKKGKDASQKRAENETDHLSSEAIIASGYGAAHAACASFVMSLWPLVPCFVRPPMTPTVERAIERLFTGTPLCIFSESSPKPMRCTAALRLLRNLVGDEGSIGIYNTPDLTSIDGYVPLSFLVAVTNDLKRLERDRFLNANNTVTCYGAVGESIEVPYERAITLHCETSQKFYVSFMAFDNETLDAWMQAAEYFICVNAACCHGASGVN